MASHRTPNAAARLLKILPVGAGIVVATDPNSGTDAGIARLALHGWDVLWTAADRVQFTDAAAHVEAEAAAERAAENADAIEEIEDRHSACEAAEDRLSRLGGLGLRLVFPTATAAAITHVTANRGITFALVGVIASVVLALAVLSLRVVWLRKRERAALAIVGAGSYMVFHLRRVDALLDGQMNRVRLAEVARARTVARAAWRHLAGDATVEWTLANRDRILAAQRRTAIVTGV